MPNRDFENVFFKWTLWLRVVISIFSGQTLAEQAPTVGRLLVPGSMDSDGTRVMSEDPKFSIIPPAGWTVTYSKGGNGPTLILQEPVSKPISGSKAPMFRRNLVLAVSQEASPIDELRLKSFRGDLEKFYGKNALTRDFQVLDVKFFNWRGNQDGILAYSSWMAGDIQMEQMNVLISSSSKQYMITYTDMASRFIPESAEMAAAWQSIMSIELTGEAPLRFTELAVISGLLLTVLLGLFSYKMIRRRRFSSMFDQIDEGEHSLHAVVVSELDGDVITEEDEEDSFVGKRQKKTKSLAKPRKVEVEFDPISFEQSAAISELPVKKSSKAKKYSSEPLMMISSNGNEPDSVQDISIPQKNGDKDQQYSELEESESWALSASH
jgi:hypothetical protein